MNMALFEGTAGGSKQRLEFALALHALKIIAYKTSQKSVV